MRHDAPATRPGRRPATTRAELQDVAVALFVARGYDATSVQDIAQEAGVSRRTFFRYFTSKTDLVWGDFEREVERMRAELFAAPADRPLMAVLREELVRFNTVPAEHETLHRQRLRLIMTEPDLLARSTLRYEQWRDVVADFAAARLGVSAASLLPRAIGHALLGVALAAYEQWLDGEGDLPALLDTAARALESGFGHETR